MIGLGIMGRGMAMNLLKTGKHLVVWNRTPSKCDELKAHGATVVANPADVVEQAAVTYSMVRVPVTHTNPRHSPSSCSHVAH